MERLEYIIPLNDEIIKPVLFLLSLSSYLANESIELIRKNYHVLVQKYDT